jgi:hypothetical protein
LAAEYAPNSCSSLAACPFVRISHQQRAKHRESLVGTRLALTFALDVKYTLVWMIVRVAVQLLEVFASQFILWVDH